MLNQIEEQSAVACNRVSVGRQAVRREVNMRIRSGSQPTQTMSVEIFCECGLRLCADRMQIGIELYEGVLGSPGQYVVTTHHDTDPTQRLISRHHGFLVVERKQEPSANGAEPALGVVTESAS